MALLTCTAFMSCTEDDDEEKTEKPDTPDTPDKPDTNTDESVKLGYCPDTKHPHLIDLGNGMLWSCCNVDAKKPSDFGGFYAWGETKEKSKYDITTYEFSDKKNENSCWELDHMLESRGIYIPHIYSISATVFDVAYVKMGKQWMMPNAEDAEKLGEKCKQSLAYLNGVEGCKLTGPSGKSIFLPGGGFKRGKEWSSYDDGSHDGYPFSIFWCGTREWGEFGDEPIDAIWFVCNADWGTQTLEGYGKIWEWSIDVNIGKRTDGYMVRPIKNYIN